MSRSAAGRGLNTLHIIAGALADARGRVLLAQRPAGKELAGRWEFPGGKLAAGETPRAGLARELNEELGIELASARPLIAVRHRRPDGSTLIIDCWRVDSWRGEPAALDGQQLLWCERARLPEVDILEADHAIVTALRLPPAFVHVANPATLAERIPGRPGRERVAWLVPLLAPDSGILRRLHARGDAVFVLDPRTPPPPGVGSVYSAAHRFEQAAEPRLPAGRLVHSAAEALAAAADGADFLLVPDPVPGRTELAGIAAASLPYYANVAEPDSAGAARPAGSETPQPTGRLWWRTRPPRLLL